MTKAGWGGPGAALALALALTTAARADTCVSPANVLYHGCPATHGAQVVLVPDDLPLPPPGEADEIVVTGSYTGRDAREDGATSPAPVGIAVVGGRVVGVNRARMDGILVVGPGGGPRLEIATSVPFAGRSFDLTRIEERMAFIKEVSAAGASVLQSHLLIIDGRVDTRPVENAPRAVRRVLYTRGGSFGLWESDGAVTLDDAARAVAAEVAPNMALNLDMGSFNVCLRRRDGASEPCGLNASGWEGRLSTLLVLSRR
ncbi:MAG: hypothetical protein AAFR52_18985 [Pseudomonadota bacterium]